MKSFCIKIKVFIKLFLFYVFYRTNLYKKKKSFHRFQKLERLVYLIEYVLLY